LRAGCTTGLTAQNEATTISPRFWSGRLAPAAGGCRDSERPRGTTLNRPPLRHPSGKRCPSPAGKASTSGLRNAWGAAYQETTPFPGHVCLLQECTVRGTSYTTGRTIVVVLQRLVEGSSPSHSPGRVCTEYILKTKKKQNHQPRGPVLASSLDALSELASDAGLPPSLSLAEPGQRAPNPVAAAAP
jgi:hypothetical protein